MSLIFKKALRKSFKLGPLKINLSRNRVGYSAGNTLKVYKYRIELNKNRSE